MDIDLDDVESYPAAVYKEYKQKKLQDKYLERKEENIKKQEDVFHQSCENRVLQLA